MQKEPNTRRLSRTDDLNNHQHLGEILSQTVHRDSMDSSISHARSTIPTPEAVPASQISVLQQSGSVTPSSGLLEDTEARSFSTAGSDTYSRSILPSPPQYISDVASLSSFTEHGSPTGPPSFSGTSPAGTIGINSDLPRTTPRVASVPI